MCSVRGCLKDAKCSGREFLLFQPWFNQLRLGLVFHALFEA